MRVRSPAFRRTSQGRRDIAGERRRCRLLERCLAQMENDVPLLIPEVNPEHLDIVKRQKCYKNGGYIVTNPLLDDRTAFR